MEYKFEENNDDNYSENNPENKIEEAIEEVADELQINLPKVHMPITLKLIALFTLIGGLSIVGSLFSDIIKPEQINYEYYFLRIIIGILSIIIAWLIIERRRLAIWLYSIIVIMGLFTNPIIVLLPLAVTFYLYLNKNHFSPSIFDNAIAYALTHFKDFLKKRVS